MKGINDLKYFKDSPFNYDLKGEQKFIHMYGQFNCKRLKAKTAEQILDTFKDQMPEEHLSEEQVSFIKEISGKEVLAYLCHSYQDRPDIFVYPEGNTPFSVECFI